MSPTSFTLRLVEHALAELAERAEAMAYAELIACLADIEAAGRSAAGDLVVAVLDREVQRRDSEARA